MYCGFAVTEDVEGTPASLLLEHVKRHADRDKLTCVIVSKPEGSGVR